MVAMASHVGWGQTVPSELDVVIRRGRLKLPAFGARAALLLAL